MSAFLGLLTALSLGQASALMPEQCGPAPIFPGELPNKETADREQLADARKRVRAHSQAVTTWIGCKDDRSRWLFGWMTEEQQERWTEDVNKTHNQRVELERGLNERIRAFNARLNAENQGDAAGS